MGERGQSRMPTLGAAMSDEEEDYTAGAAGGTSLANKPNASKKVNERNEEARGD